MYEQFFGLTEKPFSIQPDPSFLYWGRTHRLAYAMLEYGVLNSAGISVITGEVGCGKTTLIHRLLDQLSETHTVSLLSNVQKGRGDLLSWVLMGFDQPFAGMSHVEMFAQLQSFFIGEYAKGKRVVLIIDEAQNLSIDMLEELRLLSNINAGKDQLLQLILIGQPQLKDLLNEPELLQLAQRVGADFHLTPLSRQEVQSYIETRLSIAGCRRRIFTERAIDQVAEQSRGVPRVINVIADTALVYAFSAEDLVVGVEIIRNVIRDKMEYGVFGLAAGEVGAPLKPLKKGPDAFVREDETPERQDVPERPDVIEQNAVGRMNVAAASDVEPANDGDAVHLDDEPRYQARTGASAKLSVVPARHVNTEISQEQIPAVVPVAISEQPATQTVAKTVADLKSTVQINTEAPSSAMATAEPETTAEQGIVTGVIVVGSDKNTSPEAAIRSVGDGRAIVFVSVGGTTDATNIARNAGAVVINENEQALTTGGRSRNAAYRQLKKTAPDLKYVQFIEAGSVLDSNWVTSAEKFMNRRPEVAMLEGGIKPKTGNALDHLSIAEQKRRENDGEIQTTLSGSVLVRAEQFEAVGGFRGDLLMAETIDLCIRLRRRGSHIWRLEDVMMTSRPEKQSKKSWWSDASERGRANAYVASLHGGPPERLGVVDVARAVFWGGVFPVGIVVLSILGAMAAVVLSSITMAPLAGALVFGIGIGIYCLKVIASAFRHGIFKLSSWKFGFRTVMGRFSEFFGIVAFWFGARRAKRAG